MISISDFFKPPNWLQKTIYRKWYLVSSREEYVIYIGKYDVCKDIMDYLPKDDTYLIVRCKNLTFKMKDSLMLD